ncbi:MAG: hypothetical protein A2X08_08945 [Bacteroidetes bacterium GWA2_32_17]|nr:MAG: hypothetical protein A2X08_08945 [Bacteroidetes bacterium GWA2_32_17]
MKIYLFILTISINILNHVFAQTTYYVNGNNSTASDYNSGTSPSAAWKTLRRACMDTTTPAPGDTIIIMQGIYRASLIPKKSGSPGNYITFRSDTTFSTKITGIVLLDSVIAEGAIWQQDTLWHQLDTSLHNVWKIQLDSTKHGYVEAYRDTQRMPSFKSIDGGGSQLPLDSSYIYQNHVSSGKSFVSDSLNTLFVFLEDTVSSPDIYSWYITKNNGVFINNQSYIKIQGFEIDSFAEVGVLVQGCNHIAIDSDSIHHNGRTGIAINFTNSNILVTNNDVSYNGIGLGYSSGISIFRATNSSLYIIGNKSHHNADSATFSFSPSDGNGFIIDESADVGQNGGCTFKNNVSYFNQGSGIRIHRSKNCEVKNNTTYKNGCNEMDIGDQIAPATLADTLILLDNIIIENNIFFAKSNKYPFSMSFTHNFGSIISNFNDFYRNNAISNSLLFNITDSLNLMYIGVDSISQFQNITGNDINSFVADPLLDSILHLQSISPCIDTGNPDLYNDGQTWITDTTDQDPDGTRMDIGAYYFSHSSGIEANILQNNSVNVYPNPFNETTTLEIRNWKNQNYDLKIYDVFGKIVYQSTINKSTPLSSGEGSGVRSVLNLNLPNGIYLLQIKSDNFVQTKKLEVIK